MRGFTLIEIIIYLGIVGLVFTLMILFLWQAIAGQIKTDCYREVHQNGRFAMQKIFSLIKKSAAINSPGSGEASSSLSLAMVEPDLNPTIFDVSDHKIRITQGGNSSYLTTQQLKVSSLEFKNLSAPGTPGIVKVNFTLEYLNLANKIEYQASLDFGSSVSRLISNEGSCLGTPAECSSYATSTACLNQFGCSWNGNCSGTAVLCSDITTMEDCQIQDGCSWQP